MARGVDGAKRRLLGERLRRFDQNDRTVAEFCQAEGVSEASFYQWRKKLRAASGRTATADAQREFVPLRIISAAMIEIHLPNGARIVLPAGDLAAMEAAVAAAGRVQSHAAREVA